MLIDVAAFPTYHKINSLFKRDPQTHAFLPDFTCDEFQYLKDNEWTGHEKIDGTNCRLLINAENDNGYDVNGRTNDAQLHTHLIAKLNSVAEGVRNSGYFYEPAILFGEGIGPKIQSSTNYTPDHNFVLFDVLVEGIFLKQSAVQEIAENFGLIYAPQLFTGNLNEACDFVKRGFKSTIAVNKDYDAEGLILRPAVNLNNRLGSRIITKLKTKDFK